MRADAKMMRCTLPYGSVSFSGYVNWVCMRTRTSARTGTSLVRPEPRTGDEYMHVMYQVQSMYTVGASIA